MSYRQFAQDFKDFVQKLLNAQEFHEFDQLIGYLFCKPDWPDGIPKHAFERVESELYDEVKKQLNVKELVLGELSTALSHFVARLNEMNDFFGKKNPISLFTCSLEDDFELESEYASGKQKMFSARVEMKSGVIQTIIQEMPNYANELEPYCNEMKNQWKQWNSVSQKREVFQKAHETFITHMRNWIPAQLAIAKQASNSQHQAKENALRQADAAIVKYNKARDEYYTSNWPGDAYNQMIASKTAYEEATAFYEGATCPQCIYQDAMNSNLKTLAGMIEMHADSLMPLLKARDTIKKVRGDFQQKRRDFVNALLSTTFSMNEFRNPTRSNPSIQIAEGSNQNAPTHRQTPKPVSLPPLPASTREHDHVSIVYLEKFIVHRYNNNFSI